MKGMVVPVFFFHNKRKKSQKLSSLICINVMLDVYLPSSQNLVPRKFGPILVHLSEYACTRP